MIGEWLAGRLVAFARGVGRICAAIAAGDRDWDAAGYDSGHDSDCACAACRAGRGAGGGGP